MQPDDLYFVIPTYRLRDVGETVKIYDEHFWRNGHSPTFHQPRLPAYVPELRITNLAVAGASVDLLLVRHGDDVGVNVIRQVGDLSVVVAK